MEECNKDKPQEYENVVIFETEAYKVKHVVPRPDPMRPDSIFIPKNDCGCGSQKDLEGF